MQFVLLHVVKSIIVLGHSRSIWVSSVAKYSLNSVQVYRVQLDFFLYFFSFFPLGFFEVLSHIGLRPNQNLLSIFQRHFGPFDVLFVFKFYVFAISVVPKTWFITTSPVTLKYT